MRLNFTGNSFVFGRTNRGIAPTTFSANIGGKELPNASEFHNKQLCF